MVTHKLDDEFQYSSDRNKRSHASKYIVDLIADDKDEKQHGEPMLLDDTIANLIPTDMKVDTFTSNEAGTFTDSGRHCIYIKGGKHRMVSTTVNNILNALDTPAHHNTPIVKCAKTISKDQDIMKIDMSLNIYGPSSIFQVLLDGNHHQLGFIFHSDLRTPPFKTVNMVHQQTILNVGAQDFKTPQSGLLMEKLLIPLNNFSNRSKPSAKTKRRTASSPSPMRILVTSIRHKDFPKFTSLTSFRLSFTILTVSNMETTITCTKTKMKMLL